MVEREWTEEGNDAAGVSLAATLPGARFVGCDDVVARRCTVEAARCRPGDVFVARPTGDGDGHEEAALAVARGAAAVVAERMVPTHGAPLCIVPDSTWALARLAHACAGDPARRLVVIAVAGTSGKTTTAWLTASVLAEAGIRVGVLSDLGCLDAEASLPEAADLERPQVLAAWLRRLAVSGCTHAVVEVSSGMLAAHALAGVACDTVVVTNVATAHLDRHGTPAAYRGLLRRAVGSLAPSGCLVFDADDRRACRLAARHRGPTVAAALRAPADVTAVPVEQSLGGRTILVAAGGHTAAVALATPTSSFVRDALLAAAVGLRQAVPLERVCRGLEAAGSVPGRMERLDCGQDAAVFLDRASSGHALSSALASLRRLTPGRLVLVAEEEAAAAVAPAGPFAARAGRWCDDVLVVPSTVLDEHAGSDAVAAYARVDRLLSRTGRDDCVLVLGRPPAGGGTSGDPGDPAASGPLARLVEGWLRLVHPAERGGRRAA